MDGVVERIDRSTSTEERAGHEFRYRLGSGYVDGADVVLDAACGVGYGARLVPRARRYVGVDIVDVVEPEHRPYGEWIVADLCAWVPDFDVDVALCFETLEHVADVDAVIDLCCRARRYIVCSVPIVPTAGYNPYHLHDFDVDELPNRFAVREWSLVQHVLQPSEASAIYVFRRP